MTHWKLAHPAVLLAAMLTWSPRPPSPQQDVAGTITVTNGQTPHIGIPDFLALDRDPATAAAGKAMADVLWSDLSFEGKFEPVPRDRTAAIPPAATVDAIPFDRWSQVGASYVTYATVQKQGAGLVVQLRVFSVAERRDVFQESFGPAADERRIAHKISDDVHKKLFGIDGVALTEIAFVSDRDNERLKDTVQNRTVKEVYIADYDGANERRVTPYRSLTIEPAWSPDGLSLAYTTYFFGAPDLVIQKIYEIGSSRPLNGAGGFSSYGPTWSPDGHKLAFYSSRDHSGYTAIWVVDADGKNLHQLTFAQSTIESTPSWSPRGNLIAFTSSRSGEAQVWVMNSDGTGRQRLSVGSNSCDKATWSPDSRYLAYACRLTQSSGYDIILWDFAKQVSVALTGGEGSNESPSFSPNGRHIIFMTTRWGKAQLASVSVTGGKVTQVTRVGNNTFPNWGPLSR